MNVNFFKITKCVYQTEVMQILIKNTAISKVNPQKSFFFSKNGTLNTSAIWIIKQKLREVIAHTKNSLPLRLFVKKIFYC